MMRALVAPGVPAPGANRALVDDPAAAMAMAWHREACGLKHLGSRQCRYWPYHVHSANRVIADLAAMGVTVLAAAPSKESSDA